MTLFGRRTFRFSELVLSTATRFYLEVLRVFVADIRSMESKFIVCGKDDVSPSSNVQLEFTLFICGGRVLACCSSRLHVHSANRSR